MEAVAPNAPLPSVPGRLCAVWRPHSVRGAWVGRSVRELFASGCFGKAALTVDVDSLAARGGVVVARSMAPPRTRPRHAPDEEPNDDGVASSAVQKARSLVVGDEAPEVVAAAGAAALEHRVQLRETVRVADAILEPAMPLLARALNNTPHIGIVAVYDVTAVVHQATQSESGSQRHLLIAVDKPPGIPVHHGGRFVWHTVLGCLAQGQWRLAGETPSSTLLEAVLREPHHGDGNLSPPHFTWQPAARSRAGADAISSIQASCAATLAELQAFCGERARSAASSLRFWRATHRLDRGTSGILFLASSGPAAALAARAMRTVEGDDAAALSSGTTTRGGVDATAVVAQASESVAEQTTPRKSKRYVARLLGSPDAFDRLAAAVCSRESASSQLPPCVRVDMPLAPATAGRREARPSPGGAEEESTSAQPPARAATTEFRRVAETRAAAVASGSFLVTADLVHAGRQHQVRRHAAAIGFPVLGDTTYGGAAASLGLSVTSRGAWAPAATVQLLLCGTADAPAESAAAEDAPAASSSVTDRDEGDGAILLLRSVEYVLPLPDCDLLRVVTPDWPPWAAAAAPFFSTPTPPPCG